MFLPDWNTHPDECLNKYLILIKQVSEDLAADVEAKSIVNLSAKSFQTIFFVIIYGNKEIKNIHSVPNEIRLCLWWSLF